MANTKKPTTTTAKKAPVKKTVEKVKEEPEVKETPKKELTPDEIAEAMQTSMAQDIIKSIVEKALAEQAKTYTQQPVFVPAKEEMVSLLYMGAVTEGVTVSLGKLGEIQGRGGTRDIPKKEFMQNLTQPVLKRLQDRRLIVLDGFTDDERERYGIVYTDGELLSPDIYQKLLTYDEDKICEIFEKACLRHKALMATLFIDAYIANDKRVTRPLVERLNKISKNTDKDGMFKGILKDMTAQSSDDI